MFILILNTDTRRETVELTNELLGRISKVNGKTYYYKGFLHDIPFRKEARGVYLIDIDKWDWHGMYYTYRVESNIHKEGFKTGAQYWGQDDERSGQVSGE